MEELLASVHDFLSKNQELKPQLPFSLTKKEGSTQRAEKRIAKIFQYDPDEYNTKSLLHLKFEEWEKQPSSSFVQLKEPLGYDTNDSQRLVIALCLQLGQSDAHSHILRRIYSFVLDRLRANRPRSDDAETIAGSIYDQLHKDGRGSLKDLTDSIENMIQAGSRYKNISEKLGIGSLFILGTDIPPGV